MTPPIPQHAMVLTAGLGRRLRPLTDRLPKPLVNVGGQTLLDRILERLVEVGVEEVALNLHHLGARIEEHLQGRDRPRLQYSREAELLETGGGVRQALPLLGAEPFFVVNGDILWLDGHTPALKRLAQLWDPARMDALLLVHSAAQARGIEGFGDFFLDPEGLVRRRREREVAPFIFAGVQILKPGLFESAPDGPFSLNVLYDRALEAGRLFGLRHDGLWFHVGSLDGLAEAETELGGEQPLWMRTHLDR